LLVFPLLPN